MFMNTHDPKTYLWQNITELMGGESVSISKVQEKTGVGRGTVQRISEGSTSVGLDVITKIAAAFNVQPWQLLVPNISRAELPHLGETKVMFDLPLSSEVVAALSNASEQEQRKADALLRVEFGLTDFGNASGANSAPQQPISRLLHA